MPIELTNKRFAKLSNRAALTAHFFVFLAITVSVTAVQLAGQNKAGGEIRGTVMDPSGAAIPGVAVKVQNTATGVVTDLTTNSSGIYDAVSLVPGIYSISFAKTGFRELIRTNIVLTVETITENAQLEVGAVSQHVTVTATPTLLKTETHDQGATLTTTVLSELPGVNQSWFDYSYLLPGANGANGVGGAAINASPAQNNNGADIGFNGQGGYQSLVLMNGGNATFLPGQNSEVVPLEDIAEVQVEQSNFSAEYGNAYSTMNVIMKSGTNQFHGSLYEFVQNSAFEARNFFTPSVPPMRYNEFGGTIGGPVLKNKLFFFFGFQDNPIRTYSTGIYTYPTAAMRAGDLAGLPQVYNPSTLVQNANGAYSRTPFAGNIIPTADISPQAAKIMSYYPMPNLPGDVNNYYGAVSSPLTARNYDWRVDYDITSRNRLSASQNFLDEPSFSPNIGPTCYESIDCITNVDHYQTDVITDDWSMTPTIVNEYRQSLQRSWQLFNADDNGKDWSSTLGIAQLSGTAAPTNIGTSFKHSVLGYATITEADTLTWVKGKHILKFGGEWDNTRDNLAWADINAGNFSFSGDFTNNPQSPTNTGLGLGDFLLGLPDGWSDGWTPADGNRTYDGQAFAQDDYKIKPNLTVNLGLRWLVQHGYTEQFNRLGSFDPTIVNPATGTLGAMWYGGQRIGQRAHGNNALQATKWNNLEPRLGFAWSFKPNWVLRGGYGIFDNMWGGDTFQNGVGTGISVSGTEINPNPLVPWGTLAGGHAPPAIPVFPPSASFYNGTGVSYTPYHISQPYVQNWSFGVQHQFGGGSMVGASWVGARGVDLADPSDLNQVSEANIIKYGGIGVNMQPYRPYPQYTGITYQAFGGWSSYNSLQITFQKRFSHGLMVDTNYTWSHALDTNTQNGWAGAESDYEIALDPALSYGNSMVDQRNAWNGEFVYQLPFGLGKSFLNKGGVLNAVLGGWQLSNMWTWESGTPYKITWGGPNFDFSGSGTWYPNRVCNGAVSTPTIGEWFNTACFPSAAIGTYGNSGRNILSGPSFGVMNASLAKSFNLGFLGEQGRLQIRMDVSDVLNSPDFGLPNAAVTPPPTTAGTITTALQQRNIQLGALLTF
jgi:Carboxypeptidase regulatory-like domain